MTEPIEIGFHAPSETPIFLGPANRSPTLDELRDPDEDGYLPTIVLDASQSRRFREVLDEIEGETVTD